MYITGSAITAQHQVFKNGVSIFEKKDVDLPGLLAGLFKFLDIKYPKFYKMDNLSKLGLLTSEVLLKDTLEPGRYKPQDVGIILSNASSSLGADLKYFESTKDIASPALFVYTLPNIVIGEICIKHKFQGENAFFIFEKFDAGFIEKYVSNLINNNILQACICGWVDTIKEEYKAVLFLVEKFADPINTGIPVTIFTKENLNKIYHLSNG